MRELKHLGVSPQEFGAVVAEAQHLLDESRTRALHLEGFAQEIHDRACEQIQKLKSMVESLYQECQSKDQTIHGLSNDLGALQDEVTLVQSQLQSQVSKLSKYETILGHKDSEIQRLMTELGVAKQSLASSLEMREQLQASFAASSASRIGERVEEVPVPVHHSVQPVVVETQSTNNAILEAIQSLSARLDGMSSRVDAGEQGRQPMPVHLHGRNGVGVSSLPSSGLPIPAKRFLNEPFGGDPGDDGEGENDDEEELVQDGSPTIEREIVDSRALQQAKLDPIPNTPADFRNWKNTLILLLGRLDISD